MTKSNLIYNLAPGPGNYRLPSDFGQYDKIKHRGGQSYLDDWDY